MMCMKTKKKNKKKKKRKAIQTKFLKRASAICNLHVYYIFAPILHENSLVFTNQNRAIFHLHYQTRY